MKFENTSIWGFDHAIRGCRNPMNSWDKSDTSDCDYFYDECIEECPYYTYCDNGIGNLIRCIIGKNDLKLMQNLIQAGSDERKFMRQIMVSVDITAPLFWYKEFDTYKIGTVANSTSTMHKLSTTPITMDCFETDDLQPDLIWSCNGNFPWSIESTVKQYVNALEDLRKIYIETKDKRYWKELIRWLPESWLQKRTITMNYEVLRNMYFARRNHKLTEWHTFCNWVESLPYAKELIMYEGGDK